MKRENKDFREYYVVIKKIGEGFGEIHEAIEKETKKKRAIKIIDKNLIVNPFRNKLIKDPTPEQMKPYINCFYNEINNMKKCEGENSVKFYEFFDTKDEFVIVMELCDENLISYIAKKKTGLSIDEIKDIILQLNNTFKLMNKNKIIYRDLKLENILIKYTNKEKTKYKIKLKLGDGSTLITELRKELSSMKNKHYSNKFNAPEILENKSFNEKCDLWSLGVIIYVLFFKNYPYTGLTVDAIKDSIKKYGQKNLKKSKNPKLDDLISKLLIIDPNKRLGWNEFFKHPFIINDYKDIYEIVKRIGDGGSGVIYEAKNKETGEHRAIKIFDKNNIKDQFQNAYIRMPTDEEMKTFIDKFYKEMNNMKIIEGINKENENAVKVYESYETDNEFAFVMELCDCNLLNYFINKKELFNIQKIKDLLLQLNNSFKIMHENKILNRALNLNNILLKFQNEQKTKFTAKLKLTEESLLLKDLTDNSFNESSITKDIKLKAPEIITNKKDSEKSDLWSLGIIIYVLCCKTYPYKNDDANEIIKTINSANYISINSENKDLNDLVEKLLTVDQNNRINWEDYFNHPFFNDKDGTDEMKSIRKEDYKKYYKIIKNIGSGGFGNVFKASKKDTGEIRAIKTIDKKRIREDYMNENLEEMSDELMEKYINNCYAEVKGMKIVESENNKNTVKFFECFETEEEFAIVMELCDESLLRYVTNKNRGLSNKEIREILVQLNNSFKIMNKKRLVHRDLKLENILIKKESENNIIFKLTDYGLSRQLLTISKKLSSKAGTPGFTAPEILKYEEGLEKYNQECDLWSLGVIIYVLYFREYPYKGNNELAILNKIQNSGHKLLKKFQDPNLDDLVKKLLTEDPNKRITWDEYFKHAFFTSQKIINNQNRKNKEKINNEIIIRLDIKKKHLSNDIYFFDKEHINDVNEENIELYYNNKKINFRKFFIPKEEGEYEIKIIFKNKIKNCSYMFNKCSAITHIDLSSFDASEVTNMSYMFSECNNLQSVILSNINAANVTDMSYMFNKCSELKKIEFPETFLTENLENMTSMFHSCQKLSEVIFSPSFKTDKVTSMKTLFGKCYDLKRLVLIYFNTEQVKDMSYMFDQCNNLEEILLNQSIFQTSKVMTMSHMFKDCQALKDIDVSFFNIKNVKYTSYMFADCKQLNEVQFTYSDINKEANMIHMFDGCKNIKVIDISNFNVNEPKKVENMFDNTDNIAKIVVNQNCLKDYKKMFKKINNFCVEEI